MNKKDLAQKIIVLRGKNGWTQQELAEMCGTTQRTVAAWETERSIPRKAMLVRIARVFGLPDEYFLTEVTQDTAGSDFVAEFSDLLEQQTGLSHSKKAELLDQVIRTLNK